jgi:glyoxylase-like metal-dependent hydrolase (beta-lactamase superfamily II)
MTDKPTYEIRLLRMGRSQVPGPEIYWMSHWDSWELIYFWMVVIRQPGFTAIINTGPPRDITELNRFWREFAGERCEMVREDSDHPEVALRAIGVDPGEVNYVFITPLQSYASGNIPLFKNATICISRRGWIEDFHAPLRESHVPRRLRIPDDVVKYLCITSPEKLRLLPDEESEVVPGIRTFWTGVHHRSSMAVSIDTLKGRVVASDAFFKYENLEQNIPLGIAESLAECETSYARIRKSADILLPLYDPDVLKRHPNGEIVGTSA